MTLIFGSQAGDALETLRSQGLHAPEKPDYEIPQIPVDITEIGDEDLMVLYSKFTAYADFIGVQVAVAHVDERQREKRISSLESSMMARPDGKPEGRVTFAKAAVAADPAVIAQKVALETAYAYRKLIESLAANVERDTALVSRELTRRTSTSTRSARWSA